MPATRSVVLTGSDHAGKTALAGALARAGVAVVPEAALQIIDELVAEQGVDGHERWRAERITEFQALVARRQLELEARAPAGNRVLDRGLADGVAFCRLAGAPLPSELDDAALRARYDHVVVLDTVMPFDPRPGTGRLNDLARSYALRDALMRVYFELGYAPIALPAVPLEERLARVRALL